MKRSKQTDHSVDSDTSTVTDKHTHEYNSRPEMTTEVKVTLSPKTSILNQANVFHRSLSQPCRCTHYLFGHNLHLNTPRLQRRPEKYKRTEGILAIHRPHPDYRQTHAHHDEEEGMP